MRKISRPTASVAGLIGAGLLGTAPHPAVAQYYPGGYPAYASQTYSYGLNLPQVPLPTGSDEIRAADGTTCKSNTASNGTYLDAGAIGSQDIGGNFNQGSVYARVIVPLGDQPKRIDCTSLYQLEIERLKGELQLVKMGAGGGSRQAVLSEPAKKGNWQTDGWNDKGWSGKAAPAKVGGPQTEASVTAKAKRARITAAPAIGAWETTTMKTIDERR